MSDPKQPWTPGPWELFGGRVIRALNGEVAKPLAETVAVFRRGVGMVRGTKEENANGVIMAAAPALAEALARFVVDGEGCAACGMEGRPGCGCKQEQGRAALDACGWKWGGR